MSNTQSPFLSRSHSPAIVPDLLLRPLRVVKPELRFRRVSCAATRLPANRFPAAEAQLPAPAAVLHQSRKCLPIQSSLDSTALVDRPSLSRAARERRNCPFPIGKRKTPTQKIFPIRSALTNVPALVSFKIACPDPVATLPPRLRPVSKTSRETLAQQEQTLHN